MSMSMKPQGLEPIPEETEQVAKRACPKGTLAMQLRDALGPIYTDEAFADLFPKRGRGALSPASLAMVTVLQALEGLTDRQAAEYVRTRIDWKYALSLPLSDEGFDASILSDFRERLMAHGAVERVLEPILHLSRERGWLRAGGKQRTDSTAVLSSVRALNSLESVGESMRATLNAIAEVEPDWLTAKLDPDWFERYVHRFEMARFPKGESKKEQLRKQVGQDVDRLLLALDETSAPKAARELPEVALLRQIFAQHYEKKGDHVQWRDGPAVDNHERIVSPYDPQARSSRKRDMTWQGWKVHLTETCDQDRHIPHLITHVETTPATLQDSEIMQEISDDLRAKDLAPSEHLVDQGYTSANQLVEQAKQGTEIVGLMQEETSWQHREQTGYEVRSFDLDWDKRVAICPQGQKSISWLPAVDREGHCTEVIRFATAICRDCPARVLCTRSHVAGRTLTLHPKEEHDALVSRREEQRTPEFLERYNRRAGIEGTISQATRITRIRRSPYSGLQKTHLHHVAIAAGINLVRIGAHLQAQARGKPSRPSRPRSPFARLQPLEVA
jgi:transposase